MNLLHTIVAFIVALGVLIVVHEYGHYLVARLCGVKVLRFSVGFGRPLLVQATRQRSDRVDDRRHPLRRLREDAGRARRRRSRRTRRHARSTARASGGASRSSSPGRWPISSSPSRSTPGCSCTACPRRARSSAPRPRAALAAAAGLRAGDTVRAVDGESIATWQELRWRVLQVGAAAPAAAAGGGRRARRICAMPRSTCARFRPTTWRATRWSGSGCASIVRRSSR